VEGLSLGERVKSALLGFCESMRTDGLDLVIERVEGTKVYFNLIVTPEACDECILSAAFLETVLLSEIQGSVPEITTVSVADSRHSGNPHNS
jgi:hypothetical protein